MKKLMRMVVLCVVLALSLTIGAYAAESSPCPSRQRTCPQPARS